MVYYLISIVFICDRFLKLLVSINLDYGQKIELFSFLDLTYLKNTGIAFSFLSGNNDVLIWVNVIIISLIMFVIIKSSQKKGIVYSAYGIILGGAMSNLWDRYFYNGVIDYIDFKIFPVFNIADTAITIGAVLLVISTIADIITSGKNKKLENVS
ncbi:signal peptidase II [Elusimicrobiota bacterium]